jgi:hypothetical protein
MKLICSLKIKILKNPKLFQIWKKADFRKKKIKKPEMVREGCLKLPAGAAWGQFSLQPKLILSNFFWKISQLHQHKAPLLPQTNPNLLSHFTLGAFSLTTNLQSPYSVCRSLPVFTGHLLPGHQAYWGRPPTGSTLVTHAFFINRLEICLSGAFEFRFLLESHNSKAQMRRSGIPPVGL